MRWQTRGFGTAKRMSALSDTFLQNAPAVHTPSQQSPPWRAWARLRRHMPAMVGLVVILILIGGAALAPLIVGPNPNASDFANRKQPPSAKHVFGTDPLGRDVFSRIVYGGRVSLLVGVLGVTIYLMIGGVLGAISGYYRGNIDAAIQRLTDIMLAFPTILLVITFVTFTEPGVTNLFLAIGLLNWPYVVRLVRAEVLSLREREYVLAARSVGVSDFRILLRHVFPALAPILIVTATFGIADAILIESALSFLGLGVPPPTPSWGGMIRDAVSITILEQMPWLWITPGVTIVICVLAVNFIGDGLTAALNPRQQQ